MKHIFIVNSMAGKGLGERWIETIKDVTSKIGVNPEIYKTTPTDFGETMVRELCSRNKGDLRFYACGGDGTLNNVVNGAYGQRKVEIGCLPIGSGNDFVRNFVNSGDFYDIESQINGTSKKVDILQYSGIIDEKFQEKYAINMFNIGFDANVASDMLLFKKVPLVNGSAPYMLSIGLNFLTKRGADLTIETGKRTVHSGRVLFVNICNGTFLGGGIKGAPFALIDDGKMDINIVNNISRLEFINLFPKYKKGTHMLEKDISKIIQYLQKEKLRITPNSKNVKLGVDGEVFSFDGPVEFAVAPKKMNFIIPQRSENQ